MRNNWLAQVLIKLPTVLKQTVAKSQKPNYTWTYVDCAEIKTNPRKILCINKTTKKA